MQRLVLSNPSRRNLQNIRVGESSKGQKWGCGAREHLLGRVGCSVYFCLLEWVDEWVDRSSWTSEWQQLALLSSSGVFRSPVAQALWPQFLWTEEIMLLLWGWWILYRSVLCASSVQRCAFVPIFISVRHLYIPLYFSQTLIPSSGRWCEIVALALIR